MGLLAFKYWIVWHGVCSTDSNRFIQLKESYVNGYWASRTSEFLQQDVIQNVMLIRAIPDTVFIIGVVSLIIFIIKAMFHIKTIVQRRRRYDRRRRVLTW